MAGLSDAAETSLLNLMFKNTAWANFGDATGLPASAAAGNIGLALTNASGYADTDTTMANANVLTYTGYTQQNVARNTGWTVSGTAPTQVVNAALVQFGNMTAGGPQTAHALGLSFHNSQTRLDLWQNLTADLVINNGVNPQFAASALVITLD